MDKRKNLKKIKKVAQRKKKSFHPFEIKIDKNRFPKRKGNKARLFASKIVDDLIKLHDSEMRLNILYENVKSYKKILDKRVSLKRPVSYVTKIKFIQEIDSFDLEYENFCMRSYNYRETLRNFCTQFLGIKVFGYKNFLDDSKMRELGLDKDFSKFRKNNLCIILDNRRDIIHRITKNFEDENKKISARLKQQKENSDRVTKAVIEIIKIQDSVCRKISEDKQKI